MRFPTYVVLVGVLLTSPALAGGTWSLPGSSESKGGNETDDPDNVVVLKAQGLIYTLSTAGNSDVGDSTNVVDTSQCTTGLRFTPIVVSGSMDVDPEQCEKKSNNTFACTKLDTGFDGLTKTSLSLDAPVGWFRIDIDAFAGEGLLSLRCEK